MPESTAKDTTLRWRNLKTGLLFLFGMAILGWLGFYIGRNTGLLTPHHTLHLFSPDSKGLQEGNFVGISGKKVGTVESIEFRRERDTNGVSITLDIQGDEFFALVTSDSRATIKSLGILGDKIVDIQLGRSAQHLKDGDEIALGIQPGLEDLTASAIDAMKNVDELTSKINRGEGSLGKLITTDSLTNKVNATLANFNTLTSKLSNGKGLLPKLLNDREFAVEIERTAANLSEITAKLKDGNGSVGKFLLGDEFLSHLDKASVHADSLFTLLGNPNGSLAKFSQDPLLYNSMNTSIQSAHQAIGSLDSLLTDFKKNPGRYVHVSVF